MPSYFAKDEVQNITIDATLDIRIFAEFIAPALDINTRFVGEEPLDHITNQYNREMERNLSRYNIKFKEIQRKESDKEFKLIDCKESNFRKLNKSVYT